MKTSEGLVLKLVCPTNNSTVARKLGLKLQLANFTDSEAKYPLQNSPILRPPSGSETWKLPTILGSKVIRDLLGFILWILEGRSGQQSPQNLLSHGGSGSYGGITRRLNPLCTRNQQASEGSDPGKY